MTDDNKCLGIFGWIFGHKYMKSNWGDTYTRDYCWRCGKKVQE